MHRNRNPLALTSLIAAAALLISACTPESARWSSVESAKENRVDFVTVAHKVNFPPGTAMVASDEEEHLADFLSTLEYGYGDQVTLDVGPMRSDKAANTLAKKRIETVMAMLRRLDVPSRIAPRPTIEGALSRDAVVVTLGRYVVTGPKCPDWRKPEAIDYTNTPPSNFGCATMTNLDLMVANPGDLVRGTPGGAADADFASRGIQRYRAGEISKSLKPELPKLYSGSGSGGGGGGGGN